jgi:hypothetical protein
LTIFVAFANKDNVTKIPGCNSVENLSTLLHCFSALSAEMKDRPFGQVIFLKNFFFILFTVPYGSLKSLFIRQHKR